MVNVVINIIFWAVFSYFAFSVLYLFIFSFAGKFFYSSRKKPGLSVMPEKKIAILVPSYKEDGVICSTAENMLLLDYPKELFDVYIIADSFKKETLENLKKLDVNVIEVSFEKSTKTRALNAAFKAISKQYDIALISDADNILAADFLLKVNSRFMAGENAVQGRRVAKNLDSSFAILDACSEGINNHIFRKGPNALGMSSSVIGSGMAFDFKTIQSILSQIDAVGGFDKILQLKVLETGSLIQYIDDALVFDEKVDSPDAFKQQRKRWVSSQFIYLKQFFGPALHYLFKGNISYFNLALISNLVVPRAFLLIMLPVLVLVAIFVSAPAVWMSVILLFIYIITLGMALPKELVNKDLLKAVLRLPGAVLMMIGMLFNMKKANKTFIHTVHTKTEVSNSMFRKAEK